MVIKRIQEPKSFFQHLLAKRKVVDQRLHSIKEELLKRKNGNDEIEDEKEMTSCTDKFLEMFVSPLLQ